MLEDEIFCPSCGENTEHIVIKSGQENLVRCIECETVHPVARERERLVTLRVIVNKDDISTPYRINIPENEELHVGEELLVDDVTQDVVMTEITSLETDRRVERATAGTVKTVWARALDEVPLKISVYKKGLTHPFKIGIQGDEVIGTGEVREIEGTRFRIVKIKLRGEGFADQAAAKDIARVWGREL